MSGKTADELETENAQHVATIKQQSKVIEELKNDLAYAGRKSGSKHSNGSS
jgi:hypothetical protein